MAEYSLKGEGKGESACTAPVDEYIVLNYGVVYVLAYDDTSYKTVKDQIQSVKSLSGKGIGSIEVIAGDHEKPTGCVVFAVSSSAAVFLHVKVRTYSRP